MSFPEITPDLTPVESTLTIEGYTDLVKSLMVNKSRLTKPFRLFADVDGMLLPSARTKEAAEGFTGSAFVKTLEMNYDNKIMENTGLIWWDTAVVEKFVELSKHPLIDVVWLTAWMSNAPYTLDQLFGIKSKGFLSWPLKMSDYDQVFKGYTIENLQKEYPSKFIWLDDRANRKDPYKSHYFAKFDDLSYDSDGNAVILTEDPEVKPKWYVPDEDEDTFEIKASDYLNIVTDSYVGLTLSHIDEILAWVDENK